MNFDVTKIRQDFPILSTTINGKKLIYFDNAATSQKPRKMIDSLVEFYSKYNANIHRGIHHLSQIATQKYEDTRALIAKIFHLDPSEIIFTKNNTESLNLVIQGLGRNLSKGSNIVISEVEHHSNVVPWQLLKEHYDFELRYIEFDDDGEIMIDRLDKLIDSNTKILSFTWVSNTFGLIYDAKTIINTAKRLNPNIIVILDAGQYVPHGVFDFTEIGADFVTFSAHKMYGPTGVGILLGKKNLLENMPPLLGGGDMIKLVTKENSVFNDIPYKFEAGTPNIADVIAFGASIEYLLHIGFENIKAYENQLGEYLVEKLIQEENLELYGKGRRSSSRIPLASFNLKGIHAHDVGSLLDQEGIAVRTGHHCTQLIMNKLGIPASVRASLCFYNTQEEINRLIEAIKKIKKIFYT